jgi:hypothetical protein
MAVISGRLPMIPAMDDVSAACILRPVAVESARSILQRYSLRWVEYVRVPVQASIAPGIHYH